MTCWLFSFDCWHGTQHSLMDRGLGAMDQRLRGAFSSTAISSQPEIYIDKGVVPRWRYGRAAADRPRGRGRETTSHSALPPLTSCPLHAAINELNTKLLHWPASACRRRRLREK